jgi:hypothetical protein
VSWKLGISTSQGNLRFPVGMKLGISGKLSCDGDKNLVEDLEITYFVDVFRDGNDSRWERM